MKLAFVDEDTYNTGKDYADIPLDRLLSKEYAEQQAARIDLSQAQFHAAVRPESDAPTAVEHTTHHTVVDKDHNVVTITQTLMLPAGVVVPETGIIFNNGMSYFSLDPESVNLIEGGQRPRFVMSPTIVTRYDKPYFALGSAGRLDDPPDDPAGTGAGARLRHGCAPPRWTRRVSLSVIWRTRFPTWTGPIWCWRRTSRTRCGRALNARGHRLREPPNRIGMLNAIRIFPGSGVLSGGP